MTTTILARFSVILSIFFLLTACEEVTTTSSGAFGADTTVKRTYFFGNSDDPESTDTGARPGAIRRGSNVFINPEALNPRAKSRAIVVPADGKKIEINLLNASVEAAAKAVLGNTLGKKYVIADNVKGRITIQTTGPVPKSVLFELFEAALNASGVRIEQEGSILKIVSGASGNKTFRLASQGPGNGASIIVAPLKWIAAEQMLNLLTHLIEDGLSVVADPKRNLILMSGTRKQIESALDALNLFDVDVLKGKSVALVQLIAANPDDVVEELNTIFEANEGRLLKGVVEFVPNKRLGSILVITSRSQYLAEAQRWIRELDRTAGGSRRYVKVYELQNRNAVEVAEVLSGLIGELASDVAAVEGEAAKPAALSKSQVVADDGRNALVVRALRLEHQEIKKLLLVLDNSPKQVLLEATIAEVTLNDEVSLGVRWFFKSGNFSNTFSDLASGGTGATFPGFSTVFAAGDAAAALNALAGVTDVKVISAPTLMVLDNKDAILQIGDQVPVATRTSVDVSNPNAPVVTSIEYRDTGVILNVHVRIGKTGRVILDITQEVSDVSSTNTSGIDSPTIRQRKITTTVVVQDGATLALGGLVQESDNITETKVPGLGDIPVLGAAFRSKDITKKRTELLILIRPSVVLNDTDAKNTTEYWRARLGQANGLLQTGLGQPKHTVEELFD